MSKRDEIRGMKKERARILRELSIRRGIWSDIFGGRALSAEPPGPSSTAWFRMSECDAVERMVNAVDFPRMPKRKKARAKVLPLRRVS